MLEVRFAIQFGIKYKRTKMKNNWKEIAEKASFQKENTRLHLYRNSDYTLWNMIGDKIWVNVFFQVGWQVWDRICNQIRGEK
jgi:hypothetical protein